ncbi:hypothetical protein V1283_005866 [Bradyrhizobium sp. AZCC 2262]
MDEPADFYRRLGFTLAERGYFGSINHLALLGADPLELIGIPNGAPAGRIGLLEVSRASCLALCSRVTL